MAACVLASPARADDEGRRNPEGGWVCGSNPRACEPVNVPPVPEPSCQCGPNGEWVKCSQCSGDSTSTSTPTRPQPQGVPPLVKFAVGAVVGAVVVSAFAIAPAHTASTFTKSQSARQAREAWNDERARLKALEQAGRQAEVLRGELGRSLRQAATPPVVRLAQQRSGYTPIATPPPPDPWSPDGACAQVLASHDASLERARDRANAQARAQLPTVQGLVKRAKSEALGLVAKQVGARKLLAHGKALQQDYKRAQEMKAFLDELSRCEEKRIVDPTDDCELVIFDRVNAELKAFLDELQAGAGDAHARVREAAAFYRNYIKDLERDLERHAALAARCR